jgi:hypothetical protein
MMGVVVLAFIGPAAFGQSANQGGGGGMYFTGAPRGKSYDCSTCHVDAAHQIRADITFDGVPFFASSYTPGKTVQITIALSGEHLGMSAFRNVNTFLAEIDDDAGKPIATFGGFDASMVTVDNGAVIAAAGLAQQTSWTFHWTAPPAGTGPLTLYTSLVDGNGGDGTQNLPSDPLGDDVATAALRLCEGAQPCTPLAPRGLADSAVGCTIAAGTHHGGGESMWLIVLALALAARARGAWLLVASLILVGCFDPKLPGECPDRVCGNLTSPDAAPDLCNGELWECTAWEATSPGVATRSCMDLHQVGTTKCQPASSAALPALDQNKYRCEVEPILDRSCAMLGCHGTETGHPLRIYARGRLRNDETVPQVSTCLNPGSPVNLQQQGTGTIMCVGWSAHTATEWQKNFDAARLFLLGTTPAASALVREPLAGSPLTHSGIKLWSSTADPDYQTILAWLGGATRATCNTGSN